MEFKKDYKWIELALLLSDTSQCRQRHGAIILNGSKPVGMGVNVDRNVPAYMSEEHIRAHASVHAEIAALIRAGDNARGATIYVARRGKNGFEANSKPCENCALALEVAGVKRVVHTVS